MATRGRPRAFDEEIALEAAMRVFWDRGYEATGVDDLAKAMGISMSTLYSSFGDKETLFRSALAKYEGIYDVPGFLRSKEPTAVVIQKLLDANARRLTHAGQPRGCMLALSLHSCADELSRLRGFVNQHRNANRIAIEKRLQSAKRAGELADGTDVRSLSRFLINTMQGMSIQARSGASEKDLLAVGKWAMKAWPYPKVN